jgi:glycosyltransferase involved in cell wall biosynthesis
MNLLIITQKVDENDQLLGFSINWFRRFAKKFDSIYILCLEKGKFDLPENVRVISLGKDRGVSKLGQLFNFYKNIWMLRKNYDAVFAFMNAIWIVLGSWLWHLLGKKVFLWYAHKTIRLKHRLAEKFADGIFTSTPEGFRLKSKKIIIVGQGIDTDIFKPLEGSEFIVRSSLSPEPRTVNHELKLLSVGRIAPIKNYEILIEAAKILKERGLEFSITFIGEPVFPQDREYEKKLKAMVQEEGLENRIHFMGKVAHKDLPRYYQSNQIFVNLGKTGSLDKTIVEAMASGLTVISSNEAAVKFLPKELVVKSDDPKQLADKIEEVAGKDFSRQLRQYVLENYSLNNLIEKISFHIWKSLSQN